MKRSVTAATLLLAGLVQGASAADVQLNQTQMLGRRLVDQHCGVCHTRPTLVAAGMYGPELSRETAGGNQEVVRGIVTDGTPRMPGFRHMFNPEQIAAIAAYLAVLPPGHQVVNLPAK
jgi:mono/diheme cytochrome c family protein